MYRINKFLFPVVVSAFLILPAVRIAAQTQEQPLSSKEFVNLLYMLPRSPQKRDELIEEIRRRGIGFALTDGMRSLVSTKSGNDALLRRTLEEAERRRVNPTAAALPSDTEGHELLERTRNVTLAAANAMPDLARNTARSGGTGELTNLKNLYLEYFRGKKMLTLDQPGQPALRRGTIREVERFRDAVRGLIERGRKVILPSESR